MEDIRTRRYAVRFLARQGSASRSHFSAMRIRALCSRRSSVFFDDAMASLGAAGPFTSKR